MTLTAPTARRWLLLAGALGLAWLAQAASRTGRSAKAKRPPADKGPGETRTEREQRLLRECRGKPNAGACEGFAS
jgi:threonine/homoserine/homoserine lactone efflux protein